MTIDRNHTNLLMYLCACAVKGKAPEKTRLEGVDFDALYSLASTHKLAATAAVALRKAGIDSNAISKALFESVRRRALFDSERVAILKTFEEHGIWYMPLKGIVIQDLYPEYGMREMADNDILFDNSRTDDVKNIMVSRGFKIQHFGVGAHDVYYKKPVLNFEMHRMLFSRGNGVLMNEYYCDTAKLLVKDSGNRYGYHLGNEDFYVYFVCHAYKHYSTSGSGLRTLLDIYVFLNHFQDLDWQYIESEVKKLEVSEFEETIRNLSLKLFDEEALSEKEQDVYDFIAAAGVYGNADTKVLNALGKEKSSFFDKAGYVLKRLSVPFSEKNPNYETYKGTYPVFYEHKILLPLLPFYRVGRAITTRRKVAVSEFSAVIRKDKE